MIPFTPKWFKQKEQRALELEQSKIEYKIKRMIELARSEKECGKRNIVCALVKRLVSLDVELDEIKMKLKAIKEGHAPHLS